MGACVLIAEANELIRIGLRSVVQRIRKVTSIEEAVDGPQAISIARQTRPDLIILGSGVQTREGDNIIKRLASQGKDARHPRILVFGPSAERYRVSAAFRSGAHGYVLNSCKSDELTTAIRTILGGKTYLSPAAASGFVEGMIDLAGMS